MLLVVGVQLGDIDYYKTKIYLGIIFSWYNNIIINNVTYIIRLTPLISPSTFLS